MRIEQSESGKTMKSHRNVVLINKESLDDQSLNYTKRNNPITLLDGI